MFNHEYFVINFKTSKNVDVKNKTIEIKALEDIARTLAIIGDVIDFLIGVTVLIVFVFFAHKLK